jgi:hypothetical protein
MNQTRQADTDKGQEGNAEEVDAENPAMASVVTDHKWSMMELMTYPIIIISSYHRGILSAFCPRYISTNRSF